jgi:hypothetical protein
MRFEVAALSAGAFLIAFTTAAAQESGASQCGLFQAKVAQTERVMRSCSEALYDRRDTEEAQALCQSAGAPADEAVALLREFGANPARFANTACSPEERRPLVLKLQAANAWQIKALTLFQSGGAGPGRFAAN